MKLPKSKNIKADRYIAGSSSFGKKTAKIKLSANESALGPSPKAVREYNKVSKNFKRYPDSDGVSLRKILSKKFRLDPSRIILGSGSDQIFEIICKAFINKNDEVIVPQYSFIIYRMYSKISGAKVIYAKEKNHSKADTLIALADENQIQLEKLIFIDDNSTYISEMLGIGIQAYLACWGYEKMNVPSHFQQTELINDFGDLDNLINTKIYN